MKEQLKNIGILKFKSGTIMMKKIDYVDGKLILEYDIASGQDDAVKEELEKEIKAYFEKTMFSATVKIEGKKEKNGHRKRSKH